MKYALVIDVPSGVDEVTCIYTDSNGFTQQVFYKLKPLPSFKAVDLNDSRDVVMFCHGWNTCLAEMTGETE